MSFDLDPADERTELEMCITEIHRLKAELAEARGIIQHILHETGQAVKSGLWIDATQFHERAERLVEGMKRE